MTNKIRPATTAETAANLSAAVAKLTGGVVIPPAPPECETEDEKTAYAFGYWQGLHAARTAGVPASETPGCNCPGNGKPEKHLHAPNCPYRTSGVSAFVTYAHKEAPNAERFRQLASDPLPAWAVDVRPDGVALPADRDEALVATFESMLAIWSDALDGKPWPATYTAPRVKALYERTRARGVPVDEKPIEHDDPSKFPSKADIDRAHGVSADVERLRAALRLAIEHGSFPQGSGVLRELQQALADGVPVPFARGSWQHAVDDHLVGYGRTSEEFASPHEAVSWLLQQTSDAAVVNAGVSASDEPGAAGMALAIKEHREKQTQVLRGLLACCRAWEPDVRILGNVRAGDAARALEHVLGVSPTDSNTIDKQPPTNKGDDE